MVYDIALGTKRKDLNPKNTKMEWSQLVERLRNVTYCDHTMKQYSEMSKAQRTEAKDIGFFIGGLTVKRKVTYRSIISLDIDEVADDTLDKLRTWLQGSTYVIHSTHSSLPDAPRYRVVAPLSKLLLADEYGAVMRILHDKFDIPLDESTFDFNRIMFLPSIPKDAKYFFEESIGEPIYAEALLRDNNWQDLSGIKVPNKVRVQDPKHKGGMVGAFCRKYTIREALSLFLSDIWKIENNGRYTLVGSTTFGGGVIYEDTYLYSNHSSDQYLGRCHNAYDAVRLYKFGSDKRADAMMASLCETLGLKVDDGKPHALTLSDMDEDSRAVLKERLEVDKNGDLKTSLTNALAILEYDPEVRDLFAYDLFSEMAVLKRTPYWRTFDIVAENEDCKNVQTYEGMTDVDESYLRLHFEQKYGFNTKTLALNDALNIIEHKNSFHPIRDYLNSLKWDGEPRLETIFIDCFGCEDTLYSREVGLKFFVGAVRRVFIPAAKMDYIPVLVSEEGLGKSRFIKRMAKLWGSDTFYTFDGSKDAYEQLRGVWLLEIPELNGVQSKATNSRKAFITKGSDRYRAAYMKYVRTYKRQCAFIASENDTVFLDDPSEEGRRWWGLMCKRQKIKINVHSDEFLDLVDQYWAEAVHHYALGVLPVLSQTADIQAKELRRVHKAEDTEEGSLIDYLNMPVPDNWYKMKVLDHKMYWESSDRIEWCGKPREFICTTEVAREFYGYDRKDMNPQRSKKVQDAIRRTGLFQQDGSKKRFGDYGTALAWIRLPEENNETDIV